MFSNKTFSFKNCCFLEIILFDFYFREQQRIKVGDRVRVKPSVTTPQYKWGSVNHTSIGVVTSISFNNRDITVDFPMQTNWAGLVSEMELVPSYHPGVTCDGCGVGPITGSRFKCKQCNNFDFCERCFSTKRTHKHTFNRIAEPSSAAVFAGRPGRRRHRSSGLDSSTTSMVLSNGPQGKQMKY